MVLGFLLFLRIIYILQILLPTEITPINPTQPLTVCDVLKDLQEYRGKIVQIRGRWNGPILEGRACAPLKTGDYEWPSGVAIQFPSSRTLEREEPVAWALDQEAYNQIERERLQALEHTTEILATFIGRLDAREEGLQILRRPDGDVITNGYGHLGVYPAQLVIATVKDLVHELR